MTDPQETTPFSAQNATTGTFDPNSTTGDTPTLPGELPPRIGRFEVRARLGEGAFGEVFRAYDPQLDREVALKVARPGTLTSPQRVQRFLREARAAANLRHPHIVPLFETGQDGDRYYLAAAFIPGGTLDAEMKAAHGPLPLARSAALIRKLAEGLGYAHRQGIVHRDVKPANVLLDDHGDPLVADFGLAARVEGDEKLTQEGAILGTPAYMSPEQAAGRSGEAGPAADQYALGVMLYEMLTGRRPFAGTGHGLLAAHVSQTPASPRALDRRLPRDLETICLKCLEKEPSKRYGSCEELAEDLRRWQNGEPIQARPLSLVERTWRGCRRNPVVASLTALVVFVLVSATGIAWYLAARAFKGEADATENERTAIKNGEKAVEKGTLARRLLYDANATLIQGHWEAHRLGLLRTLLTRQEPAADAIDNRGWEWHYQQRLAHAEFRVLTGHEGGVYGVAFAPDGLRVASCGEDRTVRVWNPATGAPIWTLRGHKQPVQRVVYSPDGLLLASAAGNRRGGTGEVKVWNATTGEELTAITTSKAAHALAFAADGQTVIVGCRDRSLHIYDATTGREQRSIPHTIPPWGAVDVQALALSPDGRTLATASLGLHTLALWDTATWQQIRVLKQDRPPPPELRADIDPPILRTFGLTGFAFSPDGRTLAVSLTHPKALSLWNVATGTRLPSLNGHTEEVEGVAFSPDGRWLASVSRDQTLRLWDASTRQAADVYYGHDGILWCLAISTDGQRIATGGADGTVRLWSPAHATNPRFLAIPRLARTFAISPDGRVLAVLPNAPGGAPSRLSLWQVDTGLEQMVPGAPVEGLAVAFQRDGQLLAVAGPGAVKLLDQTTGEVRRTLTGLRYPPTEVVFERTGELLAVAGEVLSPGGKEVRAEILLWDLRTGRNDPSVRIDPGKKSAARIGFDAGGRLLGVLHDRSLRIWDTVSGQEIQRVPLPDLNTGSIAFREDGRLLAAGQFGEVRLIELPGGALLHVLKGHTSQVDATAFDATGERLASAAADGKVKVWDLGTRQEVRTLEYPALRAGRPLLFGRDGMLVLGVRSDEKKALHLWDGRPRTPQALQRQEAGEMVAGLFEVPLERADVLARLRADPMLSPPVRALALEMARTVRAPPKRP